MTSTEVLNNNPCGSNLYNDRNDDVAGAPAALDGRKDAGTTLYTELWKACAGPLVTVPRENELVYYFPQGHIEQAEPDTDEVFAQVTLIPEPIASGFHSDDEDDDYDSDDDFSDDEILQSTIDEVDPFFSLWIQSKLCKHLIH